ncbi:hypothetical protein BOTBODRAFT_88476, partial [Botryobasidium botryosum FD-172 SS1]
HDMPIEPTPDSFSFYTVYMSHHIKPRSVESYLSGICNQLEPHFPQTRSVRKDVLVTRTLTGCKKLFTSPIQRKRPLACAEIASLQPQYAASMNHDDLLFFAMLTTGFGGLLRLGELVWPDKKDLHDYRKVTLRHTVHWLPHGFDFTLPGHKADRLFEGSRVVIVDTLTGDDPVAPFKWYLASRDAKFPYNAALWLKADGSIPLRGWFTRRLRAHFPDPNVSGHSMRIGKATNLAEAGTAPHLIQ